MTVYEHIDGSIEVLFNKESLKYKTRKNSNNPPLVVDSKEINAVLDQIVLLTATKASALPTGPTASAQLSY